MKQLIDLLRQLGGRRPGAGHCPCGPRRPRIDSFRGVVAALVGRDRMTSDTPTGLGAGCRAHPTTGSPAPRNVSHAMADQRDGGTYAVETWTDDEAEILRRYFTNLDGPVFALVNLPRS